MSCRLLPNLGFNIWDHASQYLKAVLNKSVLNKSVLNCQSLLRLADGLEYLFTILGCRVFPEWNGREAHLPVDLVAAS